MVKKINADDTVYTFTDEKGNEIEYRLNCAYNVDLPEPYNITMAFSCNPTSYNDKIDEDAKNYFAAHPEINPGKTKSEILRNYVGIQVQNHICDKALAGQANSWEQVFAQGMCIQPTFLRGRNINLGTSILVSEDILNGKEPFANAIRNFEETIGVPASRDVDAWITYPRKADLLKYVKKQDTKVEMKEQKGEKANNPKATAQDYRIDKKYKTHEQGREPEITSTDKTYTGEEVNALIRDLMQKKSRE